MTCGGKSHRIIWTDNGQLVLVDHPDWRQELAAVRLGGKPCRCLAYFLHVSRKKPSPNIRNEVSHPYRCRHGGNGSTSLSYDPYATPNMGRTPSQWRPDRVLRRRSRPLERQALSLLAENWALSNRSLVDVNALMLELARLAFARPDWPTKPPDNCEGDSDLSGGKMFYLGPEGAADGGGSRCRATPYYSGRGHWKLQIYAHASAHSVSLDLPGNPRATAAALRHYLDLVHSYVMITHSSVAAARQRQNQERYQVMHRRMATKCQRASSRIDEGTAFGIKARLELLKGAVSVGIGIELRSETARTMLINWIERQEAELRHILRFDKEVIDRCIDDKRVPNDEE
jgi:hypothetical protein